MRGWKWLEKPILEERSVMSEKARTRSRRAGSEDGFALVLAILALMLLTFLGLTMAATSSTELQIATNYRWSQQALYNAQAGLDAAKIILAPSPPLNDWSTVLPSVRAGNWAFGAAPPPLDPVVDPRDYERRGCPDRAGIGYGRVLTLGGVSYSNQTTFGGANLNGAFTIWIRRDVTPNSVTGQFSDTTDSTVAIITAEGVAPYTQESLTTAAVTNFTQANKATRILETGLGLVTQSQSSRCQGLAGQEGLAPSGENFDPCSPMKASGVAGAMGLAVVNETGNR
jgi:hypothetical protein